MQHFLMTPFLSFSRNSQLEDEMLIMQMAEVDVPAVFLLCVDIYGYN